MTGLPLIRTMKADVEQFTRTERIPLGHTDNNLRSVLAARLAFAVRLDVEIIRFVERKVNIHVQRIAIVSGIPGRKGEPGT